MQVDGLIIASAHAPGKNAVEKIVGATAVPYVLIDRFFAGSPFVGSDDERVGLMATRHLIEQGYSAIAHLGRRAVTTGVGRSQGYVRALRESGMRVRRNLILDVFGEAGGYAGTKQLLQIRPRPDAIFAASDPVAIGALRALHECGVPVPQDFGVIGVGKVRYGEDLRVPLSTVDIHSNEIGKSAASLLVGMLKGKPASLAPTCIDPTLIIRESTGVRAKVTARVSGSRRWPAG